jgi:DNA-cytosine methyltransferase
MNDAADHVGRREPTHASFFSGVGGLDLGLERAGWRTVSFSEIEPYASAVLAEHWPDTPNLGDIVALAGSLEPEGPSGRDADRGGAVGEQPQPPRRRRRVEPRADGASAWQHATLWSGGFPCQDLSVAGKRRGMGTHDDRSDTRSGLAYAFLDLVERYRPPAILLENVPGLLSSHRGKDFGALLSRLVDLGYGWAYRVLDASQFGVPQRRRRVFIVAIHAGTGLGADSAAEVLSVGTRCERHLAEGDQAGPGTAGTTRRSTDGAVGDDVAGSLSIGGHVGIQPNGQDAYSGQLVARAVTGNAHADRGDSDNLIARSLLASQGRFNDDSQQDYVIGTPADAGGVRAADGLAGRLDDRDRLAPPLRAGSHGDPGIGRNDDHERLILAPTLRQHVRPWQDEGAAVLSPTMVFTKAGRAQTDESPESWVEGEVMPTLNAFDVGDSRTTAAVVQPVAFHTSGYGAQESTELTAALQASDARLSNQVSGVIGGPSTDDDDPLLPLGLDSHRYRCCGNGVVSPVAEWIGVRLARVLL